MIESKSKITAFQGVEGAYSHLATQQIFDNARVLPCENFDDAFEAITGEKADYGVIPIENILGGRVAEIHNLLPKYNLYIIGEYFLPIHHALVALPNVDIADIKIVRSHVQAITQCRENLRKLGLKSEYSADTAGAAKALSLSQDKNAAAIASTLAAEIYGLNILCEGFEDKANNVTRFIILSREQHISEYVADKKYITSFFFTLRSIPAALYKALGGFATNGVNFLKLESYIGLDNSQASFYAEIEGHGDEKSVGNAFEELLFFTDKIKIIGTYEHAIWRKE